MRESEFAEYVEDYLREKFPEADIYEEVYLETNRFIDFLVELRDFRIVVEVENNAYGVQNGIMQTQVYTWNDPTSMAMVVYPEGHGNVGDEVKGANNTVAIVPIPYEK